MWAYLIMLLFLKNNYNLINAATKTKLFGGNGSLGIMGVVILISDPEESTEEIF